jgi:hypothetical protein
MTRWGQNLSDQEVTKAGTLSEFMWHRVPAMVR